MRLRIDDTAAAPDLVAFLLESVDCVAERVAPNEVEVSILGSRRAPYNQLELETRLAAWRAAHPDVAVAFKPAE
jgi:hypothetical protein